MQNFILMFKYINFEFQWIKDLEIQQHIFDATSDFWTDLSIEIQVMSQKPNLLAKIEVLSRKSGSFTKIKNLSQKPG